jgi:hypothetical protein
MVWTTPVTGSGARGNEPGCCIEGRDCNKYLWLLASEEGLCFVELIASNNFDNFSGQNPQNGYTIISFIEGVPESP